MGVKQVLLPGARWPYGSKGAGFESATVGTRVALLQCHLHSEVLEALAGRFHKRNKSKGFRRGRVSS